MAMTDYSEERYDDTFESVYSSLSRMVEQDSDRAEYCIRGIATCCTSGRGMTGPTAGLLEMPGSTPP